MPPQLSTMTLRNDVANSNERPISCIWPLDYPSNFRADLSLERLECPANKSFRSLQELKEWVYESQKEAIIESLNITLCESEASDYNDNSENMEKEKGEAFVEADEESPLERDLAICKKRLALLDKVAHVQSQYLASEGPRVVYNCLLEGILELVESEYGFIGEVKYDEQGEQFLHIHESTTVGWDPTTVQFLQGKSSLSFYNLPNTVFGRVVVTKQPVVDNDPVCHCPVGNPAVTTFLGIPFLNKVGDCIGMVAVANRPGGYGMQDVEFLEPFAVTGGNLIQAYQQITKNQHLIDTLEQSVRERTQKLEDAILSLAEANRKSVEASKLQLQHFACMSHEIRTPLNCIIGLSSLLLDETKLDERQEESMEMIVSSGDLLLTVVNDVLDYSKLESGNVDIAFHESSLQETLASTVHSIEYKAKSRGITVRTFYDMHLPECIHTDSRRLKQILYNLLGNATKFSQDNGVIDLTVQICSAGEPRRGYNPVVTSTAPRAEIQDHNCVLGEARASPVSTSRNYNESHPKGVPHTTIDEHENIASDAKHVLRFIIKDYGKGIHPSEFEGIFQPFRQASAETELVYGGTGLGLAVVGKLVHGLGGAITVDSEEGAWAEFTVDLPFKCATANMETLSEPLSKTTVVLVDSDQDTVSLLAPILDAYKISFVHCPSLREVERHLTSAAHTTPDRAYACLILESLYEADIYRRLATQARMVLLTYGPKFAVKESKGHFRSLGQLLPSVLIKSIAARAGGLRRRPSYRRAPSSNRLTGRQLRVLVAEDNKINQKVLGRMLERLGMQDVDIVDDGQQAVEKEASQRYDVVLMDMQMPVLDGLQACRAIMKRESGHPLPKIVFVTAHASVDMEDECTRAGSSGFLPKPFNMGDIEKCFHRLQTL